MIYLNCTSQGQIHKDRSVPSWLIFKLLLEMGLSSWYPELLTFVDSVCVGQISRYGFRTIGRLWLWYLIPNIVWISKGLNNWGFKGPVTYVQVSGGGVCRCFCGIKSLLLILKTHPSLYYERLNCFNKNILGLWILLPCDFSNALHRIL